MDPSTSSKVTVEYFDPSSLYPLISSGLLARLPLRNLHWKSASRPLRSIASLHVDLIPHDEQSGQARRSNATSETTSRAKDSENTSQSGASAEQRPFSEAGTGTSKGPLKERRHQIPGLRQTPYLKIYLLRCDDNETYKASSRKLLREWIKSNTPSQSTTSATAQESHDAFEWLIVHVVLPNTFAASQPPTVSASSGSSGTPLEKPGGSTSRWPGKGSSSVLEKIRADFNGSSKSSIDRVAQIRLHKTDIPPHLLPDLPPSVQPTLKEDQQDQESAWSDLIFKFKTLVLTSFNLRVVQYEEDIRQRDAQRNLPGWNFCTFFILKEGLARGFESVGLVEDALIGYDELAVGLDITAREVLSAEGEYNGTTFLSFTEDLRLQVEAARFSSDRRKSQSLPTEVIAKGEWEEVVTPLDETRKGYRDLILSNKISFFDFRCYLFARQMSLLLRQANAWKPRSELISRLRANRRFEQSKIIRGDSSSLPALKAGPPDDHEDLMVLAELCERGVAFIPAVGRIMRADLRNAYNHSLVEKGSDVQDVPHATLQSSVQPAQSDDLSSYTIDNVFFQWVFSSSEQILAETQTKALSIPSSSVAEMNASNTKMIPNGGAFQEPKTVLQEPKSLMHPSRINLSAPHQPSQVETSSSDISSSVVHPAVDLPQGNNLKSGAEQLAYYRAELYLLQRSALKELGRLRDWSVELGAIDKSDPLHKAGPFEEINLDDTTASSERVKIRSEAADPKTADSAGIRNELLCTALEDKHKFYRLYEVLTGNILHHFSIAKKTESIESALTDLAVLRFQLEDYATAANHFGRLAPSYVDRGWVLVGSSMLRTYAICLKKLDRKGDYVRIVLELVARVAAVERVKLLRRRGEHLASNVNVPEAEMLSNEDENFIDGYLWDLELYSRELPYESTVPLGRFFSDFHIEPYLEHSPDEDGFRIQLKIRHLLLVDVKIDKAKVKIVAASGGQGHDIWLESEGLSTLKRGLNTIWVGTNIIIPGSYIVERVVLKSQKILYVHETLSRASTRTPTRGSVSLSGASVAAAKQYIINLYPRTDALGARLESPRHVVLEDNRSVTVCISSGWNKILQGELRLRSASAGLRLQTADAEVLNRSLEITGRPRPGVLQFGQLPAQRHVRLKVPYALEQNLPEISVKIEVEYVTKGRSFSYSIVSTVSIVLPLGVNVQDIFRGNALFSKFTVSTTSSVPLRLLKSELKSSTTLNVQSASPLTAPLIIFPEQPASLVYKLTRSATAAIPLQSRSGKVKRLSLIIEYSCVDEEIERAVETAFADALDGSRYQGLSCLLSPWLLARLRSHLSSSELVRAGLVQEVQIGPFDSMRWDEVLKAVPPDRRGGVREWLRAWHNHNPVIQLPKAADPSMNRRVTIPVEVPRVQAVHTADFFLLDNDDMPLKDNTTVMVGQAIAAKLRIRHTRAWDTDEVISPVTSEKTRPVDSADAGAALSFVYEIHVKNDLWLVGGRRRAQFSAKENEEHIFPTMLLPLRPGYLPLPTVEIKPFIPPPYRLRGQTAGTTKSPPLSPNTMHDQNSDFKAPSAGKATSPTPQGQAHVHQVMGRSMALITCETDNRSQSKTILVLPDMKSTTVSLELDSPGSSALLLDTENRSMPRPPE